MATAKLWLETGRSVCLLSRDKLSSATRFTIPDDRSLPSVYQLRPGLVMRGKNTLPIGQMIRYPEESTDSRYIFSIWPFAEQDYLHSLNDYFTFCRDYYRKPVIVWTCRM